MIIEITNYFPKPGMEEAVLEHRHRGCRVREGMGLPPGEVMVHLEGAGAPVRWMCRYADEAAFQADLEKRTHDPDFTKQREAMGQMVEKFERSVYKVQA